uniref:hypothetical protein n=1 Tax=uncultured Sphingomonas sp. TaxID=158754 RepID=UPI0035CCA6D0
KVGRLSAPNGVNIAGRLTAWNSVESWMHGLLSWQLGRGDKMQALTAHMGNVALTDIIRTIAADFSTDIIRPHLIHAAEYFDRLRAYRNYYAHSSLLMWPENSEARAYLHQATAKGRFALHQTFIRIGDVERLIQHCQTLHEYASALVTIDEQGIVHPPMQQPSLLQKPLLPDNLQKPRLLPRQPKPPPQSSRD